MKFKVTIAAIVAALSAVVFVATAGQASAQVVVTSDPIQTTPGYPGCGGNTTIKDVTADFTCGNQRTFHLGPINRTVIAISTFHADGTASTTFTLTGGNAPADLKLRIVSHSGVSSSNGPPFDEVTGVMPIGTKGPVTLNYRFDCGQVDIKAILTGNGDSAGRISGPYLCVAQPTPTTTPGSTTPPTTAPPSSVAPTSVPNTSGGPGVSAVAPVSALPATGGETTSAAFLAVLALSVGLVLVGLAYHRRGLRP
jgi:LPXTG-motif cell wall-anchored protein